MALPIKTFRGKLKGKTAYNYTSKLNYKLNTYKERSELLKDILENDDFFVEYFDNYHKVHVNKEDFLSIDRNVCTALEKMAEYLYLSPDTKAGNSEKTHYTFYTDKAIKRKNSKDNLRKEKTIMFLIDKSRNFRKEVKQEILESDYIDSDFNSVVKVYNLNNPDEFILENHNYIKDLETMSTHCNELKKSEEIDYRQKAAIRDILKENKLDSILIKDKIKGTIYYNHCLPESEEINWFLTNFTDVEHMLALLKCSPRDLLSDLGILVYDLNQILKQLGLNDFEEEVIEMWRRNDYTQETIAEALEVSQQYISETLKSICNKVVKQYKENYEDWLYLNYLRGDYKKCPRCQEIKLTNKFGKDERNKDNLKSYCKKCDTGGKNAKRS